MKRIILISFLIIALAGCTANEEINTNSNENTSMKSAQSIEETIANSILDKENISTEEMDVEKEYELSRQEFSGLIFNQASCNDGSIIALTSDKNIVTWGNNCCGKIGNGEHGSGAPGAQNISASPFYIDLEEDIVYVENSESDSFAITETGEVYAWGRNAFGELGLKNGFVSKPQKLDIDCSIIKIASSNATNLFLTNEGHVLISGIDILEYKSLSHRNENIAYEYNPEISEEPIAMVTAETGYRKIELPFNCKDISIGMLHYAFLSENGEVYTKGTLIGDYDLIKPDLSHDELTKIDLPEKITDIESGSNFIVALSETGKVYLYGTKDSVFFEGECDTQLSEYIFLKGGIDCISSINCYAYCVVMIDENKDVYGFGIDKWGALDIEISNNDLSDYKIILKPTLIKKGGVKECRTDTLNSIIISENGKISIYGANGANQISFLNGDFN